MKLKWKLQSAFIGWKKHENLDKTQRALCTYSSSLWVDKSLSALVFCSLTWPTVYTYVQCMHTSFRDFRFSARLACPCRHRHYSALAASSFTLNRVLDCRERICDELLAFIFPSDEFNDLKSFLMHLMRCEFWLKLFGSFFFAPTSDAVSLSCWYAQIKFKAFCICKSLHRTYKTCEEGRKNDFWRYNTFSSPSFFLFEVWTHCCKLFENEKKHTALEENASPAKKPFSINFFFLLLRCIFKHLSLYLFFSIFFLLRTL